MTTREWAADPDRVRELVFRGAGTPLHPGRARPAPWVSDRGRRRAVALAALARHHAVPDVLTFTDAERRSVVLVRPGGPLSWSAYAN